MEPKAIFEALIVVGVAALPISELRGAIPLALFQFQMAPLWAFALAVVGNLLPVLFILTLLRHLVHALRNIALCNRFFDRLFARTRRRHSSNIERWGAVALIALVAVPLPFTGAWTGSLVAFLFGIPFWRAFGLIAVGVLIAGGIVTLGSLGVLSIQSIL